MRAGTTHLAVKAVAASKPHWNPYKVPKHVRSAPGKCGKTVLAEASGPGGTTLRIDQTKSVSTSYSKTFTIEYNALSAAVGWDITKSASITVSGAWTVPKGKHGVLKAYTKYSAKKFDVWDSQVRIWDKKGVIAYKPIGVCYTHTAR
jgi:hypothetical protein